MTDEASAKRRHRRQVREWWQILDRSMPRDITPLEAVVTLKALDADGNVILLIKKTSGLSAWEAYGMTAYSLDEWSSTTINAPTGDDE